MQRRAVGFPARGAPDVRPQHTLTLRRQRGLVLQQLYDRLPVALARRHVDGCEAQRRPRVNEPAHRCFYPSL